MFATLFNALATGINTMFVAWKASTMVTNVLGSGPIPTFAPPAVPVGPVVRRPTESRIACSPSCRR